MIGRSGQPGSRASTFSVADVAMPPPSTDFDAQNESELRLESGGEDGQTVHLRTVRLCVEVAAHDHLCRRMRRNTEKGRAAG
ncbi:hypothetical protein BGV49_08415 [Burkholderia ubonensis]|nr:hypothetical protein BGV49_08415 [Burkholderia ubonensis]